MSTARERWIGGVGLVVVGLLGSPLVEGAPPPASGPAAPTASTLSTVLPAQPRSRDALGPLPSPPPVRAPLRLPEDRQGPRAELLRAGAQALLEGRLLDARRQLLAAERVAPEPLLGFALAELSERLGERSRACRRWLFLDGEPLAPWREELRVRRAACRLPGDGWPEGWALVPLLLDARLPAAERGVLWSVLGALGRRHLSEIAGHLGDLKAPSARVRAAATAVASLVQRELYGFDEADGAIERLVAEHLRAALEAARAGNPAAAGERLRKARGFGVTLGAGGAAEVTARFVQWARLPGGRFVMGAKDREADERPPRWVALRPFELMRTEVTVAQYRRCVAAGACTAPDATCAECNWRYPDRADHPVNRVDAQQAEAFCSFIGARLPSEAQWEYAARGGQSGQQHPWGPEPPDCRRAVCAAPDKGCGEDHTWPPCSRPEGASPQGVCDLIGNVWEWVADCWHSTYERAPRDGRPFLERCHEAGYRVVRGGGYYNAPASSFLRAGFRGFMKPDQKDFGLGFRCAR